MSLLRTSTETRDCFAVAQGAAQALGRDEIDSIHLLVGLLEDATGAVPRVLAELGIRGDAVWRCAGIDAEVSPHRPTRLSLEAGRILGCATREADRREHAQVEPGHLLLALAMESVSPALAMLVGLGVSPDAIARRLGEILPIRRVDEEWLRGTVEKFPRLTAAETLALAEQVMAWRAAARSLREKRGTTEEARLLETLTRTSGSWLRLGDHHRYLAWSSAKHYAEEGHDLWYCYMLAGSALTGAVLSLESPEPDAFIEHTTSYINDYLRRQLTPMVQEN